jgi:hypothetical protein
MRGPGIAIDQATDKQSVSGRVRGASAPVPTYLVLSFLSAPPPFQRTICSSTLPLSVDLDQRVNTDKGRSRGAALIAPEGSRGLIVEVKKLKLRRSVSRDNRAAPVEPVVDPHFD